MFFWNFTNPETINGVIGFSPNIKLAYTDIKSYDLLMDKTQISTPLQLSLLNEKFALLLKIAFLIFTI